MPTTLSAVTLSADEQAAVDAFWQQRIVFKGQSLRRLEVLPRLAVSGKMDRDQAFFALMAAPIVGSGTVEFLYNPDQERAADGKFGPGGGGASPKALADNHKKDPSVGREIAGRIGHAALKGAEAVGSAGKAVAKAAGGAVGAVGKAAAGAAGSVAKAGLKLAGKAARSAGRTAVAVGKEAVSSGVEILKNNVKSSLEEGRNLMEEAVRSGPTLAYKAAKTGVKTGIGAAKVGIKAARIGAKIGGAVAKGGFKLARGIARRIGFGIENVLAAAWAKLQTVSMSARTREAVLVRFAA